MIGYEAGVQFGQRLQFRAVLNIRTEHGHQVDVALSWSEVTSRERPEEIEAAQVRPEVASDERGDLF